MSQAVSQFIAKLSAHFSKRHASEADERNWLEAMFRQFRNTDYAVLERAAEILIMSHKEVRFPLASECHEAVNKAARELNSQQSRMKMGKSHDELSLLGDWTIKLADDLIQCGLGKLAAREYWILSLHDFAREHRRLPVGPEIERCRSDAAGFDRAYEDCLRGNGGALGAALIGLGESMLARRQQLRERLLGSEAT